MPQTEKGFTLSTFGDLIAEGYRMTAHCSECRVFHDIDLTKFPPEQSYIGHVEYCSCRKRLKPQISLKELPRMSGSR